MFAPRRRCFASASASPGERRTHTVFAVWCLGLPRACVVHVLNHVFSSARFFTCCAWSGVTQHHSLSSPPRAARVEGRCLQAGRELRHAVFCGHSCASLGTPRRWSLSLLDARIGHLREQNQCLPPHRFSCEAYDVCEHHYQVAPIDLKREKFPRTETIGSHNSRANNPSNLSPVSREMISDSVELVRNSSLFSCTSNL